MKYFSYIRKSTSGQIFERQLLQLVNFCKQDSDGILPKDYNLQEDLKRDKNGNALGLKEKTKISEYITLVLESRTGVDQSRPALLKLLETMKYERTKGDICLLLVECTRLGRSYEGNMQLFQELKNHDIKFAVTTMPLLDTRVKHNNPATALVSDIVLAVFNWQAQSEHDTTMERCNAGRQQAKMRGVQFGRKNMTFEQLPKEFIKVIEEKHPDGTTISDMVDKVNRKLKSAGKKEISRPTFYNYKKIYEAAKENK